ncbi:hypothetical protein [uncultured Parabacteroides sp.]|uniref:hypothetical protein n=1 Tax=uncultured Parabacteroides sp. TaxID=512312 RepID=UPI002804E81C|nr:hypothetical protein [uncultured Parabacteroides sp.]
MFSEIAEIKSIREQKSKLSEREKELTEPTLTDLDMIGTLYGWFQEIISQKEMFRVGNVTQRKKFIFIILFLYSPSTLAGGKMKNGLRNKLGEVLGINAQTAISDNRNSLVFSYQLYKYFRQDVDFIYMEMMKKAGLKK